ncbi:hypothetical protein Thi970DRAFT_00024 [Thiorhodovibrio frisius]|uniref:Uncharacterized protein n=1 Tax=Thiorhodovibrio frisius TaxID=631362 RepID=H8YVF2_9GAMM|nr:hypothetical protein Thi970DRAFT_00024 [Thiorhodovibrio frisius]WPL23137.1 hypothetical protein Thiofri_03320 [Thiorhodovibrio frisius]
MGLTRGLIRELARKVFSEKERAEAGTANEMIRRLGV